MTDHSHNVVESSIPAGLTLPQARRNRAAKHAHHPFLVAVVARLLNR